MPTELDAFRTVVRVLPRDEAAAYRAGFQHRFCAVESPDFLWRVAELHQFSDGDFQQGYMWDCLRRADQVTEKEAWAKVDDLGIHGVVRVLWDLHSSEQILVEDYWRFDRDAVIECTPRALIEGARWLPEDIYIATAESRDAVILTHEHDSRGQVRLCLVAHADDGTTGQ